MRYRSVIAFGRAHCVKETKEKKKGFTLHMRHCECGMHQFSDDDIRNVCVIRIDTDSMTGKKHD